MVWIGILKEAADSRQRFVERLFLCLSASAYGWAEQGPQGRWCLTSMPTCSVPPTSIGIGSGGSFNELEAHIMTNTPLVPVFTGTLSNQSVQLCNARDLHHSLESQQQFSDWIKHRINQYGFIDGEDYFINLCNRSDGKAGKRRTEYHLTLDMAKELAMVENNDKGRQIRRYFISLERKTPKALPAPEPKRYNYPRKLLEQSGFVSANGKHPARLNMSMLANTKAFISPLMHLLNEMRADGHDVSAPWDEFIAMREALIAADKALEKIYMEALQVNFRSASVAGNK
ncbi:antA/AntB antirepressor family protein [Nitrosomonas sp.]|uniref:antA/AntB antirepressor family protein n=1 Tax=Nitrosomonas sp. TaxID=42353 RepID=UPI0025EDB9F2|nr:antA/AntB antirepressor family protein [Nitrosomonas sp.]MBV6447270.1 hypothetical protein [Nitrosomonas sp.]